MRALRSFALFWWDFIVGDDYRIALGVIAVFGITAVLVRAGWSPWWLTPLGVLGLLGFSVSQAAIANRRQRQR